MTKRQELIELARAMKAESAKLIAAEVSEPGSPRETEAIETWRLNRPDLHRVMQEQGALEALAHVVVHRRRQRIKQLTREGWNPSDAETESYRELMMLPD